MSDHLLRTIADLEGQIHERETQTTELKRSVNVLCGMAGIPPKYDKVESPAAAAAKAATIKADQFVNKALNTAVKDFLTARKAAGLDGPAAVEEIHAGLVQGGFEFDTYDKAAQIHSLRTSLGKSSHTFKKLTNGQYGLNDWYGIQTRKPVVKAGSLKDAAANDAPANEAPGAASEELAP